MGRGSSCTIIGGDEITFPYKFYTLQSASEKKFLAEGWFRNDDKAIEWLEREYPDEYANREKVPIEMRCWDIVK